MGRYYSGDIEGKFWFGVQSSDDASFFGGEECEPNHIEYAFSKDNDWESVTMGLKKCLAKLGKNKKKLDDFFAKNDSYNDERLAKAIGLTDTETKSMLEWYARLHLGEKIKKCLEEQDYCTFEAEL